MRNYFCVGLLNPKFNVNIGSALRACGNFNAACLIISGRRYKKSATDTSYHYRHMPLFHVENLHKSIPYDCVPVAVDIIPGARSLLQYTHPERAFYIFGPEDGTLGKSITSWCRDIIYVPTNQCMNLAGTIHVILYDRLLKQSKDTYDTTRISSNCSKNDMFICPTLSNKRNVK